jgi:predicted dinucleotide-binding enzyme
MGTSCATAVHRPPAAERDGDIAKKVLASGQGTGVHSRKILHGTNVVRAFNTIHHKTLAAEAHRDGEKVAIPIAGETDDSVRLAATLVRDAGFEPVLVGGLDCARFFDVGTRVYNKAMTAGELRAALALREPTSIDFLKGIPMIT